MSHIQKVKGEVLLQFIAIFSAEHVSEAERRDTLLNIPLCGRALRLVTHGQIKRSANVPLMLTGKPNLIYEECGSIIALSLLYDIGARTQSFFY